MLKVGYNSGTAYLKVTGSNQDSLSLAESAVTIKTNGTFEINQALADKIGIDAANADDYGISADAFVLKGGTLKLDFSSGELGTEALNSLKDALIKDYATGSQLDGFINVGQAALTGITVTDGKISWDEIQNGGGAGIVTDVTNNELANATVIGVDANDKIYGSYGSVELAEGADALNIGGQLMLNNATDKGNFVQDSQGNVASIKSDQDVSINLNGTGAVKDVTLTDSSSLNTNGNVTAKSVSAGSVTVTGNTNIDTVDAGKFETSGTLNSQKVTTNNLVAGGDINVKGDLTINEGSSFDDARVNAGNLNLEKDSEHVFKETQITANKITAGNNTQLDLTSGSHIDTDEMILESGATVYVGSDLTSEYGSITALISAGTLTLNDGSILRIDPGYDQPTAIVAAEQLSSSTIKGKIVIGKNSAFGVHFASAEALNDQLAKDGLKNGVALKQNIGAIAYFNTPVTIADNASLYLDASVDNIDVSRAGGDNIHLGSSSAIVVSKAAVEDAKKNSKAVVTIAGSNPSVASAGGKVLLSGAFNTQDKDIKIFAADGVSTLSIDNDIPVESVNGVYTGTIDNDTGTIGSLTVNDNNLNKRCPINCTIETHTFDGLALGPSV